VADYDEREPLLVAPLKASIFFLADLSRALPIHHSVDFIELASYGADADTGGHARVRFLKDLDSEIAGRHVLIVEDVVDTGLTLDYLKRNLELRHPKTVRVCVLLDKAERRQIDVRVDYVGFTIPDVFVVGYGLDYEGLYRNLPYLAVLERPEVHSSPRRVTS
jgi:hypoxanthine phosphoribosyltransferase